MLFPYILALLGLVVLIIGKSVVEALGFENR